MRAAIGVTSPSVGDKWESINKIIYHTLTREFEHMDRQIISLYLTGLSPHNSYRRSNLSVSACAPAMDEPRLLQRSSQRISIPKGVPDEAYECTMDFGKHPWEKYGLFMPLAAIHNLRTRPPVMQLQGHMESDTNATPHDDCLFWMIVFTIDYG